MKKFLITILLCQILIFSQDAYAIVPPDIVASMGAQLIGVIGIMGVFFASIFGVFYGSIKTLRASIRSSIKQEMIPEIKQVIIWQSIVIAVVISGTVLYGHFGKRYYSADRLNMLFTDNEGMVHSIQLQLSVIELYPHFYKHNYSLFIFNETGDLIKKTHNYSGFSKQIENDGFLKEFNNENNPNIIDEDYHVTLLVDGILYKINIQDLQNNHLINNTLERFTYINMGKSYISIESSLNGKNNDSPEKYEAFFILNKKKSIDANKLIKIAKMNIKSDLFYFIDNQKNQYYTDVSTVPSGIQSDYQSHAWSLYKNKNINQKIVGRDLISLINNDDGYNLQIDNMTIDIQSKAIKSFQEGKITYQIHKGLNPEGIGFSLKQ